MDMALYPSRYSKRPSLPSEKSAARTGFGRITGSGQGAAGGVSQPGCSTTAEAGVSWFTEGAGFIFP